MSDYLGRTVMKQYSNSPTLLALLENFDQWVDPRAFIDSFLHTVWDLSTAQGFALDIWGRILGRGRYIDTAQGPGDNFGFNTGGVPANNWQPWNVAPFYSGASSGNVAYALTDDYFRRLLFVKAAANIASCDAPTLNRLLRAMFGDRGRCYVGTALAGPMHIGFHFEFTPVAVERAIIEAGLFPVPAGMTPHFIYGPAEVGYEFFGFAGADLGANPDEVTGWNQAPLYRN